MAVWEGPEAFWYSPWFWSASGSEQRLASGAGFTGPLMPVPDTDAFYTPERVELVIQSIPGRDELVNWIQSKYPVDSKVIKNTTDLRMFLAQLLSRDVSGDEFARFSKAFHGTGKTSFN